MIHALTWMPAALRDAGLKVAPVDGWESRGVAAMGNVAGVMCHHTAGPRHSNMPSLDTLVGGRPDLRGPLAQIGLGRDGTCYIVAAGRCNHAGDGNWQGVTWGNSRFIAVEAENTGAADDWPWPVVQIDAYQRCVAALLRHLQRPADWCCAHREYALPQGRKPDPVFDMAAFRAAVAAILDGSAAPVELIPTAEASGAGRPTLRRNDHDPLVGLLQQRLGLAQDQHFGPHTEAAVRVFQRTRLLVPDGIVGPKTWGQLDQP